jgi:hypothetical protein
MERYRHEHRWRRAQSALGAVFHKAFLDAQVKRKYDANQAFERETYAALRQAPKVGWQWNLANQARGVSVAEIWLKKD